MSIRIVGATSADPTLVRNVSGLQVGRNLTPDGVQAAIRQIYALGLFKDVEVKAVPQARGLEVLIQVQEFPRVERVEVNGTRQVKREDVFAKLTLASGGVSNPAVLQENVGLLQELYQSKGFFLAQIEAKSKPGSKPDVEIVEFNIREGEKVKIKEVFCEGVTLFSPGKIAKWMKSKPKKEELVARSSDPLRDRLETNKEKVVEEYKKKGYINAVVTRDSFWVDSGLKNMYVKIWVDEGKQFHFGDVSFSGNTLYSAGRLKQALAFAKGDLYSQEKYDRTMSELYGVYQEVGYLYARIADQMATVDTLVSVSYEISEGVPAKINKIHIEGNTKTKDKVIRRELLVKPGQTFRRSLLLRSVRELMVLNYFAKAEPDYSVLENGDVDLIFKVEEKPTGQLQLGGGYSGQDKFVLTLGVGIPNFMGNGQSVSVNADVGGRRKSLSLSFTEPWFRDTPTLVGFDIFNVERQYYDDYTEQRTGLSLRLGRRLRWPDNFFRVLWNYRLEGLRYYEFAPGFSLSGLTDVDWPRITSSTGAAITRDSRDLAQFATRGSLVSYAVEYAGGPLQGDYQYHKHVFEASKFLKTLGKLVLVAKLKTGVIDGPKGDIGIPYSERFSPGGVDPDGIIRGYIDGSIGPRYSIDSTAVYDDSTGALLGHDYFGGGLRRGRSELIYNLELQFPVVKEQVYALAFADAGNAWLTGTQLHPFSDLKSSVGFGFRVSVPGLGTIGFDFGYGFSTIRNSRGQYLDGRKWRPHFQLGSTF
ncbi:MAG: outer membrane protein assembly factor BamA [candidate division Zixibacteria bacterium]|nr:outer membrane protein assembly factor BamA [candidate division Zixibacteria bacterium]